MSPRSPDPDALRYARHWEPVLAPAARRLLDRIDGPPAVCLDIGAGTGSLTLGAAARWPDAHIISLDASAGMLSVARERLVAAQPGSDAGRVRWLSADALHLPLEEASVDVALSSFVLQVVPDRRALLAEACRVLRPEGRLGVVTWLAGELHVAADVAYAEAVIAHGLQAHDDGLGPARTTDYQTLEEAVGDLRTAGFTAIDVRADELHHAWSPGGYLEFKEGYDDHELFDRLDPVARERLRTAVRTRFATLPEAAFEVRGPLVSAVAYKPATA